MAKTQCPNCSAEVKQGADYCPSCGEALSATCPSCGESVPKGAEFCPSCGSKTTVEEHDENTWQLEPDVLARRIDKGNMKAGSLLGWLTGRKKVVVKEGTKALVFKGGETVDEIGPGEYTVSSLTGRIKDRIKSSGFSLSDGDISVVLLKTTDTTTEVGFTGLRTSGEFEVDVTLETVFTVDDPEVFYREMVSGRSEVTVRELLDEMRGTVRNVLEAKLKDHDHDELYGNPQLVDEMEQDVEHRCRRTLEANGLRLVRIQSFDYEGDLDDIRDKRREGKKEVLEREAELETEEEKHEVEKDEMDLGKKRREAAAGDEIHKEDVEQDVKEVKHEASMKDDEREHEDEMQDIEHGHEEAKRSQDARHDVEEDEVVHEEEKKNIRTEEEVERRDTQFEQDKKEMEDLIDIKDKKDRQKMEREMEKEEHEVEMEGEKLEQRDGVDLETLASLEGVDKDVSELAKMEKAGELTPEQLDSLGAQESDELAKARQEAKKAEKERQRVEDQKEMREEMKEMMDESADRVQETADKAMDSMGETAEAAAEDTSDNVIVSGEGGSSGGDTTIVQGGGDGGGSSGGDEGGGETKMIVCPECDEEQEYGSEFCISCGAELS